MQSDGRLDELDGGTGLRRTKNKATKVNPQSFIRNLAKLLGRKLEMT